MGNAGRIYYASAIAASVLTLCSAPAIAGSEQGPDGQRPAGALISSAVPFDDLQRCVIRLMAKGGRVTPVPVKDGVALDLQMGTLFGTGGDARFSIQITDRADHREMTAFYRHPFSEKLAIKLLNDAGKRCGSGAGPTTSSH